jgi:hypothetical protein
VGRDYDRELQDGLSKNQLQKNQFAKIRWPKNSLPKRPGSGLSGAAA